MGTSVTQRTATTTIQRIRIRHIRTMHLHTTHRRSPVATTSPTTATWASQSVSLTTDPGATRAIGTTVTNTVMTGDVPGTTTAGITAAGADIARDHSSFFCGSFALLRASCRFSFIIILIACSSFSCQILPRSRKSHLSSNPWIDQKDCFSLSLLTTI